MKHKRVSGFSLAETLIILSIVGFLSLVVIFSIRHLFPFRAQAAARRLVSDVVFIKKQAETTQINAGIIFYPVQEKYAVYQSTFTNYALDPVSKKPMVRDFTFGDLRNVDIVSAVLTGGTDHIEFNPLGRNSTGGSVTFCYGGESYVVYIEINTGRVYYNKL